MVLLWRAPWIKGLVARPPVTWPRVLTVVPARNEAATVVAALKSLLGQDYPGERRIVLVDDHSDDHTGKIGARLAAGSARLELITAGPLPPDWSASSGRFQRAFATRAAHPTITCC